MAGLARRGVLGALAGGAALGKSGIAALAGGGPYAQNMWSMVGASPMTCAGETPVDSFSEGDWIKSRVADLGKELLGLDDPKTRASQIRRAMRNVDRLDPDIDASRSFSMSTRIRMQAERNVDRGISDHKGYLQRELDGFKERLKSAFA